MAVKTGIGKTGMLLAMAIALAMCLLSFLLHPVDIEVTDYGICLPSSQLWNISPIVSWILNLIAICCIAILLFLINKTYNFVRTTEPVLIALFLIATCSSPWFTETLNDSTILCLVNVLCLGIIFGAYDKKNATQQIFLMGALAGFGSMFQYAFVTMFFLYFLWALFLKILRLRETLAFILGILTPYWIGLGLGLISLGDFRLPSPSHLLTESANYTDFLFLLISIAFAAFIGFIAALANGMKLYAGNSKVNAMNLCVSTMGIVSVICIFLDFENMTAYVVTLFVAMAVQMANICALWNIQDEWIVSTFPSLVFIALFIAGIVL